VGTAIILCSWVKYNVTIKATATVRPIGETRFVQSEIDGTIKNIFIKENQIVKLGDVIARLDTAELLIKKSQVNGNLQQCKLQVIQIDSQIQSLNMQIIAERKVIERTIATARADLLRSLREYQEKQINTQTDYLTAAVSSEKETFNLQKAVAELKFAQTDSDRYRQLSANGAIGRREYDEKKLLVEQSQLNLQAAKKAVNIAQIKVQSAKVAVNPSKATVVIAQEHIPQETAKGDVSIAILAKEKESLIQRKVELQTQFKQYQKELQQLETQLRKSIIVATSNGVILKLNLRNPGQVVRATESIAEIAPNNTDLVIKTLIPTDGIKKVVIGQKVQLRFNACPYPDYGTLKGYVKAISPDTMALQNKNTDLDITPTNSYFTAIVQPASLSFGKSQHQCFIQPGMDAKAEIISREETPLQFILRKARLITDL
jgi:HlyD family secretion protein